MQIAKANSKFVTLVKQPGKEPYYSINYPLTFKGIEARDFVRKFEKLLNPCIEPETEDLKYQFLLWRQMNRWRGLLLAHKLLGLIPNFLESDSLRLTDAQVEWLILVTNIDRAMFEVIKYCDGTLRNCAEMEGQEYPFASPLELFLHISQVGHENQLLKVVTQSPNWEPPENPIPYKKTKDPGPKKVARNEFRKLLKFLEGKTPKTGSLARDYTEECKREGWAMAWLLVALEKRNEGSKEFNKIWKNYIDALRQGQSIFLHQTHWRDGYAYLNSRNRQVKLSYTIENTPNGTRLNVKPAM